MPFSDYLFLMEQASSIGVSQIALGGGNPNEHPDFPAILETTRAKYGIVPSYTTNGQNLSKSILMASAKYCGAVAVSAYEPFIDFYSAIKELTSFKIRTNIHFLLTSNSIDLAVKWLKCPPKPIVGINAIIFLLYKPVGRGNDCSMVLKKSKKVDRFFNLIQTHKTSFKLGFDSCSIPGLVKRNIGNTIGLEACEAGRFSMFISEDLHTYPCSFMAKGEGANLRKQTIQKVWQNDKSFKKIRGILFSNRCNTCLQKSICRGGCPVFDGINLC
jgi:radical SAM protein with 4Fe4S-binding SPASM domain